MFNLQKIKNWTHSSVSDDKKELETYQIFQEQFNFIKSKASEYIKEEGYTDERLQVKFEGSKVSLALLESLSSSVLHDRSLSLEEKTRRSAAISELYQRELRRIEEKIIDMSLDTRDNVYLITIYHSLEIINTLLRKSSYLLAIKNCNVRQIDNEGERASIKLKRLEDAIEIRMAEIQSRLFNDTYKRR